MYTNVKDALFRAAGNGSDDDAPKIQAAINAVAKSGGGTVFLPGGSYLINRPLVWTSPDVHLVGDGAARVVVSASFQGAGAVIIGASSAVSSPTYYGGIEKITVDLSASLDTNLSGAILMQAWFTRVALLRVVNVHGLAAASQTALMLHGGGTKTATAPMINWCSNISVHDLQVSGSFRYSVRHAADAGGAVNGTNYFGGFAYGNRKPGSIGFCIDKGAGDTTRVYGMALEDFDVGVYVGSQNNGPLDFRIEDCNTPYIAAPNISFSIPALSNRQSA